MSTLDDIYPDTLPWVLDDSVTDEYGNSAIVDEHRVVVAFMSDDGLEVDGANEIMDARGCLMAAAPELYEALCSIVRRGKDVLPADLIEEAQEALKKASNGTYND